MEAKDILDVVTRGEITRPATELETAIFKSAERTGIKEIVEQIKNSKDYKVMVKLVRGGYRNMSYDSDWQAFLKELGIKEEQDGI